jgi:hypothetical protein
MAEQSRMLSCFVLVLSLDFFSSHLAGLKTECFTIIISYQAASLMAAAFPKQAISVCVYNGVWDFFELAAGDLHLRGAGVF